MSFLLYIEEKDTLGEAQRHYYKRTIPHPKHGGPNGIEFTDNPDEAYQFEFYHNATNFQGGISELKESKVEQR